MTDSCLSVEESDIAASGVVENPTLDAPSATFDTRPSSSMSQPVATANPMSMEVNLQTVPIDEGMEVDVVTIPDGPAAADAVAPLLAFAPQTVSPPPAVSSDLTPAEEEEEEEEETPTRVRAIREEEEEPLDGLEPEVAGLPSSLTESLEASKAQAASQHGAGAAAVAEEEEEEEEEAVNTPVAVTNKEDDQQSDLTALSESEFPVSPNRAAEHEEPSQGLSSALSSGMWLCYVVQDSFG